jgi:predicted protein tyrosine phosphatase
MTVRLPPFEMTICGIPELDVHAAAGVTHVLSITDPELPDPPVFSSFAPHRRLALRFNDIIEPTPGQLAPTQYDVERLLEFGRELDATPAGHLLIHCHAGVSRSTAAATLILAQALPHLPAAEIFEAVVQIRPRAWPNLRILEFGDALLGRNGEIVAAVAKIYRQAFERDPAFGRMIIDNGRGREVTAAFSSTGPEVRSR